jgi:gliding motility-associated-like protein
MKAEAGCATICDNQGNLLFYTNGNKVWNKNHMVMANGDSLLGSQLRNQNCIIVPKPKSDSLYYLFAVIGSDSLQSFTYSIVNLHLDNGLGRITQKNILIARHILEKLTAVQHCNKQDLWIVTHGANNVFYSYLLTEAGLQSAPVSSNTGTQPKVDIGYLKVSPAADKMVLPINNDSLLAEVYPFDNQTGMISQPLQINSMEENTYCYGVAFSPDGSLLYVTTGGKSYDLWQFDLKSKSSFQLNNSANLIASGNNFAMQLAPDNKIYIASLNRPYINVIHHPDVSGVACEYQNQAINFAQGGSLMGLPNVVQSWMYKPDLNCENTCLSDSTGFNFYLPVYIDSVVLNFGDGTEKRLNPENDYSNLHQYQDTGQYQTYLKLYHCGGYEFVSKHININPYPVSSLEADTAICPQCSVVLDAGGGFDSYLWSNGNQNRFITVNDPGNYSVTIGKNGCFSTSNAQVREYQQVMAFPNAFTPNGDGLNDVFKAICNIDVVDFSMAIITRKGEIVYRGNEVTQGWDGKILGQYSINDTFVWFVNYSYYNELGILVKQEKKGFITLIR